VIATVNKRARTRLIGVTAIVLLLVGVILYTTMGKTGAYSKSVDDVLKDKSLVGKRVRVSGTVVPGSWNKGSNPMEFAIKAENNSQGGVINVTYSGSAPNTFGDGVVAIVTGTLEPGGKIASSDMITKCPSKYESATGAMTVANLIADKGVGITFTKVTGYVVPDSLVAPGAGERFKISDAPDGSGQTVSVTYAGAVPAGMTSGKKIVVSGKPRPDGTFAATEVAVDASQK
jgi:cytochrome c-type biogenesis protein CcmE